MPKLKKHIAFVGLMGSGKSAVGKAVAAKLEADFVDTDAEIELAANRTVSEIFSKEGEVFFRRREVEVISRVLRNPPRVIATGGGAFMNEIVRESISQRGISVWLNVDIGVLWNRIKNKHTRPLLNTNDPYRTLKELFENRRKIYNLADVTITTKKSSSINQVAVKVVEILNLRTDILENENA